MKRTFLQKLAPGFGTQLRHKGAAYHRQGRVELVDLTEEEAEARVTGGSLYDVRLSSYRDPAKIVMQCECPYFAGVGVCKHVWATLLAIDEVERGIDDAEERHLAAVDGAVAAAAPRRPAAAPRRRRPAPPPLQLVPPSTPHSAWRARVDRLLPKGDDSEVVVPVLEYHVSDTTWQDDVPLVVRVLARHPRKNGELGVARAGTLAADARRRLPPVDRELMLLRERDLRHEYGWPGSASHRQDVELQPSWSVSASALPRVLDLLAATGRVCLDVPGAAMGTTLQVDVATPFRFELGVAAPTPNAALVVGLYRRDQEVLLAQDVGRKLDSSVAIHDGRLVRLECGGASDLANELARGGPIRLPPGEVPALLAQLATLPGAAQFLAPVVGHLPAAVPEPVLFVSVPQAADAPLAATLRFDYGGQLVDAADERPILAVGTGIVRRDGAAEAASRAAVVAQGLALSPPGSATFPRARLAALATALQTAGIRVLAEGKRLRTFAGGGASLRTGIDWFELRGELRFDGRHATLPELLRRRLTAEGFVELDDGSLGMLPDTWLRQLESFRLLGGEVDGDVVRVAPSRSLLLDAMLASREASDVTVDAAFARLRQRLRAFTVLAPVDAPPAFVGQLRPYQREGLGWLRFLGEFGLGGCLADDMGLGKTVQVLALLLLVHADASAASTGRRPAKRTARAGAAVRGPSLLVAPRSVLGNWLAEARRFAPSLRVVDFSDADRWRDGAVERLAAADLVLTTYALVRSDAPRFDEHGLRFHYAILDEAQAIKNADSQSSKAVRLLHARHRLVLTGTPVENHLGDLWSLFEFLNPGMLGRLPAFRALFGRDAGDEAMAGHRALVQRALRPVLLRRTKAQVLPDLPDKVEQTLWCDPGPEQRRHYDQLAQHYRELLLGEPGGIDGRQRFVVLEALLRLRQAACHGALVDRRSRDAESAKFEELLPRLEELAAEGHKALVFSQFTSLLDLLEPRLRERGLVWERLDGGTRDRARRVERFQGDARCPLFLISLKAGGYGLNLTAAGYVFLLDPWWNPAVEMQAIDRTHRIGQTRVVHAFRLVCRGTVEERVLELQQRKKALCEAILGNERSLLQDLTRADLELLLG